MRQLGMPGGKFEVAVETDPAAGPRPAGADRVEFLVSANPGEPVKPVAKVASGGELSRISLAVQVAAAHRTARTCMIFDEVDAGIGGGVAEIVGRQLRELGERGQVLCVTHLAQVASQAHHQHACRQADGWPHQPHGCDGARADERVEELARMLGGVEITRKAREHAREMLQGLRRGRLTGRGSAALAPVRTVLAAAAAVEDQVVLLDLESEPGRDVVLAAARCRSP